MKSCETFSNPVCLLKDEFEVYTLLVFKERIAKCAVLF